MKMEGILKNLSYFRSDKYMYWKKMRLAEKRNLKIQNLRRRKDKIFV